MQKKKKEINRMGKTRDTKGWFYAKMGTKKHKNGSNLTKAENIKKVWQ